MAGFNHFAAIGATLRSECAQIVRDTAGDLRSNMRAQIQANGQVASGFMLNSVYKVTSDGTDYQGGKDALPEVAGPQDDMTAYVAVAAFYGAYQNYGTRFLPPRPFFEPAIEQTKPQLAAKLAVIDATLRGSIWA